jgi:lysophospholipase L1-like esterase
MIASAEDIEHVKVKWEPHVLALENRDRAAAPPDDPILLVGSSTFTHWKTAARDLKPLPVLNRGFGGSDMLALLTFYERLVTPIRPRTIVLYVGGNDIARGVTPEAFLKRIGVFLERVHRDLPETKIVILSLQLKPSRPETDLTRKAINDSLIDLCKTSRNAQYVDITTPTLQDGKPRIDLFGEDRLHFNEVGYQVLADTIRPVLQKVHAS